MGKSNPIVLILCGGRSLRLWPLSEYKSKNFLDVFGFSPLEVTIKRFLKVTSSDNIFLAANKQEAQALGRLNLIKKENIILEPESKNTAAAILLSLLYLKNRFIPESRIVISPVDHLIKGERNFYSALKKALKTANEGGICTLGIVPAQPTSNFGYIQINREINKGIFSVKKFIEKPSSRRAKSLIQRGNAYYNSGMFISTLATLEDEFRKYYAFYRDFSNTIAKIAPSARKISQLYKRIGNIPFDKAIMEKTKKARLIKAAFLWKDFGNWNAVYEVLSRNKKRNVKKGKVFINKGKNNLIYVNDAIKEVLVMGLDNVVFIDTPQYALLTSRSFLDDLKSSLKTMQNTL
ncbi:MAG: hypothetical protein JSV34_02350 [Candidatus Omnitrophota bacterium]|nr:MAG: hypothetical protein JSV34_02350 [Candidatus Omnitrophota bacterium]